MTIPPRQPLPNTVPLFPAGYAPLDTDFNDWIGGPLAFCTNSVVLQVQQTVQQSLPQGTTTTITFDTVLNDPYGNWDAGTNYYLAPITGWYLVTATVSLKAASAGAQFQVAADISNTSRYTGGEIPSESLTVSGAYVAVTVPMTGGEDFAETVVTATGSLTTYDTDTSAPGRYPSMEITFLSR